MNDYDPKNQSTFLSYLEMNSLYGWEMSEYIPDEGFKWLKIVSDFDVMSSGKKSLIGYLLEADLKYPDELHELHNDYPLAPQKIAVSSVMFSNYCKKLQINMK